MCSPKGRAMGKRADRKQEARDRILAAAAKRMREKGVKGLKVADVMADAGLTHGAFYSHFKNKEALINAAFHKALDHREPWLAAAATKPQRDREQTLIDTYLTAGHRDTPAQGCAFALLAREFATGTASHRTTFEQELDRSTRAIAALLQQGPADKDSAPSTKAEDAALGLLSLCVGGITLARAVNDPDLSERIMHAARAFAAASPPNQKEEAK